MISLGNTLTAELEVGRQVTGSLHLSQFLGDVHGLLLKSGGKTGDKISNSGGGADNLVWDAAAHELGATLGELFVDVSDDLLG